MDATAAVSRLLGAAADGRLEEVAARRGARLLTLFGSAARDPTRARDLDVAVLGAPTPVPGAAGSSPDLLGLVGDLVDLTGFDGVDVMDLAAASPTARHRALTGARLLAEAEPGLFARRQMAAALEFYETAWMRAADLRRMSA
ncbi:nucleotidyltransferase family protein [Kineococcus terrestris]|uniref:nucleotidyltransferase family protein n=1 Tax=Kineococcus terrestris TaxID=2044856 RepID=UPI0034DAE9B5